MGGHHQEVSDYSGEVLAPGTFPYFFICWVFVVQAKDCVIEANFIPDWRYRGSS
ncbi:hypothetical protein F5051DRAFT_447837 [Lentinula edodes]|nr:hypothetical protein F5051DRAFT_447837 [Lentinula edodes]